MILKVRVTFDNATEIAISICMQKLQLWLSERREKKVLLLCYLFIRFSCPIIQHFYIDTISEEQNSNVRQQH